MRVYEKLTLLGLKKLLLWWPCILYTRVGSSRASIREVFSANTLLSSTRTEDTVPHMFGRCNLPLLVDASFPRRDETFTPGGAKSTPLVIPWTTWRHNSLPLMRRRVSLHLALDEHRGLDLSCGSPRIATKSGVFQTPIGIFLFSRWVQCRHRTDRNLQ